MSSETLDQARERLRPYVETAQGFSGWGFSRYGNAKRLGPGNPWNYDERVGDLLSSAQSVLDMGTGGGERLSRYLRGYKGRAVATEAWDVNAPIAAERLRPLGVDVIYCEDEFLPFARASFEAWDSPTLGESSSLAALSSLNRSTTPTGRSCDRSFPGASSTGDTHLRAVWRD